MIKGEENLIPNSDRSGDELGIMRKKGGINSGKARRGKKKFRDAMLHFLDSKMSKEERQQFKESGIKSKGLDFTKRESYSLICLQKGMKDGNISDMLKIAELVGEFSPKDNTLIIPPQPKAVVRIIMPKEFKGSNKDVKPDKTVDNRKVEKRQKTRKKPKI